jgi:hypothetical protein
MTNSISTELLREHARGLVDLGAVQGQVRRLPAGSGGVFPVGAVVRAAEQQHRRRVTQQETVTQLRAGQRAR